MGKKHLFIINTPFQFLAASFIHKQYLNSIESVYYIVTTTYKPSVTQIAKMKQLFPYIKSLIYPYSSFSGRLTGMIENLINYVRLLKIMRSYCLKNSCEVFIGNVSNPFAYLFIKDSKKGNFKINFFDDGTKSILFFRDRRRNFSNLLLKTPKSKYFPFTLFYPDFFELGNLTYYTIYPNLRGSSNDLIFPIIPNLPIELQIGKKLAPEIWFVSSPTVEHGILNYEWKLKLLMELIEATSVKDMIFKWFPHRTERISSISSNLLRKKLQFKIIQPNIPFEIFYGKCSTKPLAVFSLMSSAVFNLKVIYNTNAPNIFLIKPPVKSKVYDDIIYLQGYASKNLGIKIIDNDRIYETLAKLSIKKLQ